VERFTRALFRGGARERRQCERCERASARNMKWSAREWIQPACAKHGSLYLCCIRATTDIRQMMCGTIHG
jgi:hypothetical protein